MCLLTTREKMKLLTVFPPMNLCLGGTILLISLWGWLKVKPEILLEKKKRKVVAQGGQMWKTKCLKCLPKSGLMVWVSCPMCQNTDVMFACVTSEHGGNAPAWTRGLLAMGTQLILTESRSALLPGLLQRQQRGIFVVLCVSALCTQCSVVHGELR